MAGRQKQHAVNIYLEDQERDRLREMAERECRSMTSMVNIVVRKWLASQYPTLPPPAPPAPR